MKLKTQFGLMIALFIVLSGAVITYTVQSFRHALELKAYQIALNETMTDWFRMRVYLSSILTTSLDAASTPDEWSATLENQRNLFSRVVNSSLNRSFNGEINEILGRLDKVYALIGESLDQLTEQLQDFSTAKVTTSTRNFLKSSGLAHVYNSETVADEDLGEIVLLYSRITTLINRANVYTGPFEGLLTELASAVDASVSSTIARLYALVIVAFILMDLLILLIILAVTGKITKRLEKIRETSEKIAQRDLTASALDRQRDEIGALAGNLAQTADSLRAFMDDVKATADQATGVSETVDEAAAEVTASTTEISSNIDSLRSQFERLQRTVSGAIATLQAMTSFMGNVVSDIQGQNDAIEKSASAISSMNQSIARISMKGRDRSERITGLQATVSEGEKTVEATEVLLTGISQQLGEVNNFIELINSIAEQTSILSMNAAIESAHAGESGKGFAVVADEIQKLADSTSENAKLITDTLTEIIQGVEVAKNSSHTATETFGRTVREIGEVITSLNEIVGEIAAVDGESAVLTENSHLLSVSTRELAGKTQRLDQMKDEVQGEISQMGDIFEEALGGISEIQAGSNDIMNRMIGVHAKSGDSRGIIGTLHEKLSEFKTR